MNKYNIDTNDENQGDWNRKRLSLLVTYYDTVPYMEKQPKKVSKT